MSLIYPDQAHQRVGWQSLPAELRLIIYPLTWEPRKVRVTCSSSTPDGDLCGKLWYKMTCAFIPVTAHLNTEARRVTLRHYVAIVGDPVSSFPGGKDTATYFNPSLDIVSFPWIPFLDHITDPPHKNIQRLLDIFVLAKRVMFRSPGMFTQLVEDLMYNGSDTLDRFPTLRSVDAFFCKRGHYFRFRLCSDVGCTEPTYRTYGLWREHRIRYQIIVQAESTDSPVLPHRSCREIVASLVEPTFLSPFA